MSSEIKTVARQPAYQAARAVAVPVEAHFARHRETDGLTNEACLSPVPGVQVIETIIDTAFWASLRREEGQTPRISLAWLPPEQAGNPLLFERPLPFTPEILTKLGPGVERAGIHVGVWHADGELHVWGTTREVRSYCFVLDVSEPGLLVIKHRHRDGFGKFTNVAVLKGDQVKVVDEDSAHMPDCPALLTSLLGMTSTASWRDSVNVLVQLAVSMRAHGRGGSLLVVPAAQRRGAVLLCTP